MFVSTKVLAGLVFLSVCHAFRDASNGEFPFQVAIQNTGNQHVCGGVIITPTWVLTVKECVQMYPSMFVAYGNSDSSRPAARILTKDIFYDYEFGKDHLALLELENEILYSNTTKQARLPRKGTQLKNSTLLSGWNFNQLLGKLPILSVVDSFGVITENCRTPTGATIPLLFDEFCGVDEIFPEYFSLSNLGTVISKDSIVMGILAKSQPDVVSPVVFVKISEHEDWIKGVLGSDSKQISWVNEIPKDSSNSPVAGSLAVMVASLMLPMLF